MTQSLSSMMTYIVYKDISWETCKTMFLLRLKPYQQTYFLIPHSLRKCVIYAEVRFLNCEV